MSNSTFRLLHFLKYFHLIIVDIYLNMSSMTDSFQSEWRKRISSSPEAKMATENLNFHRRKVRKMHEELSVAEEWERELQRRLTSVEEKLKPPLMRIVESLETSYQIEDSFLEAAVNEEDHERLVSVLKKKALSMDKMDRAQLLAFIKTLLSVRNCLLEKEQERGVEMMQEMASGVLKQLGRVSIDWLEVSEWEAGLLRRLIKEVEGVPAFVARMLDQFLDNINLVKNNSKSIIGTGTQEVNGSSV